jgi:hypothetical protein
MLALRDPARCGPSSCHVRASSSCRDAANHRTDNSLSWPPSQRDRLHAGRSDGTFQRHGRADCNTLERRSDHRGNRRLRGGAGAEGEAVSQCRGAAAAVGEVQLACGMSLRLQEVSRPSRRSAPRGGEDRTAACAARQPGAPQSARPPQQRHGRVTARRRVPLSPHFAVGDRRWANLHGRHLPSHPLPGTERRADGVSPDPGAIVSRLCDTRPLR